MSNSKLLFCVFLLIAFFISNTVAQDPWSQASPMPTSRFGHGVGLVKSKESLKVYVMGGFHASGAGPVSAVEEYDPATDTWTAKADIPSARGWISCTVVGGKIYTFGGYTEEGSTYSNVEEYNTDTDTWTTKKSMSTPRWGLSTVFLNGKIYAIGGADGWPVQLIDAVEEYDPVTNTWITKTTLPTPRWILSSCVVDGKIYAIGGHVRIDTKNVVEEYDPQTDTWTTRSSMPTARWGLTTSVINGKIFAIGGGTDYPPQVVLETVEEYDPGTDCCTTKSPMPGARMGLSSGSPSIDGKIYVIGGGGVELIESYSEVFVYDPMNDATDIENNSYNPFDFHLHQNYPNPFNPSTTLRYFLPESGNITLTIFNPSGQEIGRPVDGFKTAGAHQLEWQPKGLPGGIYFYKLQSDEYFQTKKLIIRN